MHVFPQILSPTCHVLGLDLLLTTPAPLPNLAWVFKGRICKTRDISPEPTELLAMPLHPRDGCWHAGSLETAHAAADTTLPAGPTPHERCQLTEGDVLHTESSRAGVSVAC